MSHSTSPLQMPTYLDLATFLYIPDTQCVSSFVVRWYPPKEASNTKATAGPSSRVHKQKRSTNHVSTQCSSLLKSLPAFPITLFRWLVNPFLTPFCCSSHQASLSGWSTILACFKRHQQIDRVLSLNISGNCISYFSGMESTCGNSLS